MQNSNDQLLLSDTFDQPYRKDRTKHDGGLLVCLISDPAHVRRLDLEILCEESIWVEVKISKYVYLFGLFCSP